MPERPAKAIIFWILMSLLLVTGFIFYVMSGLNKDKLPVEYIGPASDLPEKLFPPDSDDSVKIKRIPAPEYGTDSLEVIIGLGSNSNKYYLYLDDRPLVTPFISRLEPTAVIEGRVRHLISMPAEARDWDTCYLHLSDIFERLFIVKKKIPLNQPYQ